MEEVTTHSPLPMFPLGSVILPGDALPLHVFEPRYRAMIEDIVVGDAQFGVVLIERGHEVGGGDVRGTAGVMVRVDQAVQTPDGRYVLECTGLHRIRVLEWLPDDPYPRATVEDWPDSDHEPARDEQYQQVRDLTEKLFDVLRDISKRRDLPPPETPVLDPAGAYGEPTSLWEFASSLPLGSADRAKVLTAETPGERLRVLASAVEDVTAVAEFSRG